MKLAKFVVLVAICQTFIAPTGVAYAKGFKQYCGGAKWYPSGNAYPHLHCEDFLVFSRGKYDHIDLYQGKPYCNNAQKIIDDPEHYGIAYKQGIVSAIKTFVKDYCES